VALMAVARSDLFSIRLKVGPWVSFNPPITLAAFLQYYFESVSSFCIWLLMTFPPVILIIGCQVHQEVKCLAENWNFRIMVPTSSWYPKLCCGLLLQFPSNLHHQKYWYATWLRSIFLGNITVSSFVRFGVVWPGYYLESLMEFQFVLSVTFIASSNLAPISL
jgi:hypothetical protein